MNLAINKSELLDYQLLMLQAQLSLIKEKIRLFEVKYHQNFTEFEKIIHASDEKFEQWDDYIEWKAFQFELHELERKIEEVAHAEHITIIED